MATRLKYPPCRVNPKTDEPFKRHDWIVKDHLLIKGGRGYQDTVYYYKVVCSRCGYNDPRPPTH